MAEDFDPNDDLQPVDETGERLHEIEEMFKSKSVLERMKTLVTGLGKPKDTKEYKEAMIELQRLSAPATAIILPILAVLVLVLVSVTNTTKERVIETQVMEAETIKELDKIEEVEPPPPEDFEDMPMDMDIPTDSPNVQVDTVAPVAPNTPVSPQPQAIDAVLTVKSPVILKNIYGSTRNTGTRGAQLSRFGGDKQTEAAVLRALRWLKKKQRPDGAWNSNKIAMTSLAILSFLAHGEKPGEGEFGPTVQKALEYLIGQQRADGRFNGMDGNQYALPMATYALCESYGMTMNPNVKEAALKALEPIIKGQHPTGGWTYKCNPNSESGKYRDDTSYMGWCAQALKAAKLSKIHADGLEKAIKLAIKGFKSNAHKDGGFGYTGPSHTSGLSSVGSLCMMLLGAYSDGDVKRTQNNVVSNWKPFFASKKELEAAGIKDANVYYRKQGWEGYNLGACPQYYFYYATQARFHEGGKPWENWNRLMKPAYIKAQIIEKDAIEDANGKLRDIGHWENTDVHTDRPVMDTCLAALQLMVYYRYLPTTQAAAVKEEEVAEVTAGDSDDISVDIDL